MRRTKNAMRNIIFGFINRLVLILGPFVIRTILIKKLGAEYLGLSSLFTSILQVLNLTELGFSSAVVYSMYKPIVEKDVEKICALLNFYKKVYRIIGCVILVLGIAIMPFIRNLINGSYPNDINIYILYGIYLFNTVISYFLFAYKGALLTAHQRNDVNSNINSIMNIIQYIIQIFVIYLWKNYYVYVVIFPIITILNNIWCAVKVSQMYPQYLPKGKISKDLINDMKKQIRGLMIQKICGTTRNSLDSIFISAFLGLNMVAIYSNYYSIMTAIIGVMNIISTAIVPSIGNSIVTESVDKNYNDMNKFNFIYMWISGWCTICLACLFQPFMKIWMGEEYMFSSYFIIILLCIYFYVLKMGDIRAAYSDAKGLWWENRYRAIVESLANIILNIILGKIFGIAGIIAGTLISLLIINFGYGSQILFEFYFGKDRIIEYFKSNIIYALVTFVISIVTGLICYSVGLDGINGLIIKSIICVIIPNIMYILIYCKTKKFKEAKKFIISIVSKEGVVK
ncbi:MAG TPA: oligosaccharide flippase family protein [Clostridiaceae bacterium]|nr:oligosaccharide flippase family protein [Clostridia bacterium]HJJ18401.1 oligosaccharide flippase family protein [Clostridiaceae bacterium]